jgi:hypothetical protein
MDKNNIEIVSLDQLKEEELKDDADYLVLYDDLDATQELDFNDHPHRWWDEIPEGSDEDDTTTDGAAEATDGGPW